MPLRSAYCGAQFSLTGTVIPCMAASGRSKLFLLGVAGLLGAVSTLGACSGPPADSGVRGTVILAAGGPGFKNSWCASHACPPQVAPRPMSGTKLHVLTLPGRQEVASVWSGQDGSFQVNILPGRYSVSPGQNHWWPWGRELPAGALYGTPVEVTVPPHGFVQVTVFLSNGVM
jgi:hypothetical protein